MTDLKRCGVALVITPRDGHAHVRPDVGTARLLASQDRERRTVAATETPMLLVTLRGDPPIQYTARRFRCPHCGRSYAHQTAAAKQMERGEWPPRPGGAA